MNCTGFITARRSYASAVLGVVILSVRPSVSHKRALWLIQKNGDIFIPHARAILLVFCHPTVVGGRRPLLPKMGDRSDPLPFKNRSHRQISACNGSIVRASEKSSIMTNRKSYTGFPTSYRWSAYTLPLSPPKGDSKNDFLFLKIKLNFSWLKPATNFVCVKTTSSGVAL